MNQEKPHRSDISGTISRFVFITALFVAGLFSGQQLIAQFYTLTVNITGNGSVTKSPNQIFYVSGTNVEIEATPDFGWNFTGWSGNLTGTTNPAIINMDGDKLITANFEQNTYQLTVETDGTPGAAVSPASPVMVTHDQAQVITVTTIPAGYQFKEWTITSGTGASIFNKDLATTIVTLTDGAATVEASFELKQYTLTVITDGTAGAEVSPDAPIAVTHDVPQMISAVTIPDGYQIENWSILLGEVTFGNDTMETTTATVINGNAIVQANFVLKKYKLTLLTDGTLGATVSPSKPVRVTSGQPQIISAVTPAGYKFMNWELVSGTVTLGNDTVSTTTATLTTDDVILQANFELKKYTMSLITDGTPGATVSPALPVVVKHGVPNLISANTIPVGYQFKNWTLFSGAATFADDTMALTTATLIFGNATLMANFQKVLGITNVQIPNATMKIGDIITATITVSNDAGTPYSLVTGSIGRYPLVNLLRMNATTYLANFTITEGGNSYAALLNIPVTNLILSNGIIQNLPYNKPIIQNNDALDAKLPVINTMIVASEIMKVGDIVIMNINADSTHYTAHPLTSINGTAVTAPNVTFVEVGNGDYRLIYTVLEGDNDVAPGQLQASVVLVKPSGNFNTLPFVTISPNTLSIDAHAPLITRMEVSQDEVGVGGVVQLVITADGEGYKGAPGTVINGIPLSSGRVSLEEPAGGLYVLNYTVASGDNNVATGMLNASVFMTDSAGNNSFPYSTIVVNTMEIYTELPVAALAGTPQICEGEEAELTVFLSGRSPWRFDLNDGTTVTSYESINTSTYKIPVSPGVTTTYNIDSIWDRNAVVNTGSGSVQVKVNETAEVQIMNLASGYSIDDDPFQLIAVPSGGSFSGPGVVSATGFFYPSVAGTENSPHTIYYTLINEFGCASVDSTLVFVLGAEGDIFMPASSFCNDSEPFTVTGSNLAGATGSFTLTNMSNQAVAGLTDNGDNTALVSPVLMTEGDFIIIYEYYDGVALFLRDTFTIESVDVPTILNLNDTYCQNETPVILQSSVDYAVFKGPGISGNVTDGFVFYPDSVNAATITITCTATSSNGCTATTQKKVTVKFTPAVGFQISTSCIPDDGGEVSFENLSSDKLLVESWSWDFGDPGSGANNQSDLINPIHFYSMPGDRSISLTATTFEACAVTYVLDTIIGNKPEADFTWLSDCYVDGSDTKFINKSTSEFSSLDASTWIFTNSEGTILGEIESDPSTDTVSFSFEDDGVFNVELQIANLLGCADTVIKEISLRPTIGLGVTGYEEGFNTSQGLWTVESEDQVASWVWDVPDFAGFVQVPGDKAWFTNLPVGVVGYLENSWMQSPCFDLSGMKRPLIQLDIMKSFASGNGAVLQYMDVYEKGWKTVGESTAGIEWYNATDITNKPGGSSVGWGWDMLNPDNNWVTAAHDLDVLAGKPNVSFRIAFTTDENQTIGNQGFAFDNVFIAERTKRAVIEYFTNSSDASSMSADSVVDRFGLENSKDIIDIQYHMDYPGMDPMNENNPNPPSTRSFNSGIPQVPYAILDGGVSEQFRYDFSNLKTTPNMDAIKLLTLQVPEFDVELVVDWTGVLLEATTTVTCNVDHYSDNIDLYVVVFETSVNAYTGINGDTAFRNVVLDMLPTPAGKLLGDNWSRGNSDTRVNTWDYQPYVEDIEDLAVVVFVQDRNSRRILQAAVNFKTPQVGIGNQVQEMKSLFIYPNPAKTVVNVNLGSPTEKDGRFEIIDMNGRVVSHEHVPSGYQIYQLNVQSLYRGFYMIQWYEEGLLKGRTKLVKVD